MDEKYLQDLYTWIKDNDSSYEGRYSYDQFKQRMQDEEYASKMHSWISGIDNTFEQRRPLNIFLQLVKQPEAPKKKEGFGRVFSNPFEMDQEQQESVSPSDQSSSVSPSTDWAQVAMQGATKPIAPQPVGPVPAKQPEPQRGPVFKDQAIQEELTPEQKQQLSQYQATDEFGIPLRELQGMKPVAREEFLAKPTEEIKKEVEVKERLKKIEEETPEFLKPSVQGIKASAGKTTDTFVQDMNYQFGDAGFEFTQKGVGFNIEVKTPDGEIKNIEYNPDSPDQAVTEIQYLIRTKSTGLRNIDKIEKMYKDENKKFSTEYQVDFAIKEQNKEQEELALQTSDFLKRKTEAESSLKSINEMPLNQRPANYRDLKFQAEQNLTRINDEADEIQKRIDLIPIKIKNLETAIGKYNLSQSTQGSWVGQLKNTILTGLGGMVSGVTDIAIDIKANVVPLPTLLGEKNYEQKVRLYSDQLGIDADKVLLSPEYFDKLSDSEKRYAVLKAKEYRQMVEPLIRDEYQKSQKYGTEDEITFMEGARVALRKGFGSKSSTQQWEDLTRKNWLANVVLGGIETLPSMIGPSAWIRRAQAYAVVDDMLNKEYESNPELKDISENEKLFVKIPIGLANAWLEEKGFSNIVKNTALVKSITGRALMKATKGITPDAFKKIVSNEVSEMITDGVLRVVGGGLIEFETGALQKLNEITTKSIYNLVKEKELFDTPDTVLDVAADTFMGGLEEMIGSISISTPTIIGSAFKEKKINDIPKEYFDVFVSAAGDINIEKAFIQDLKSKIVSGEMTKQDAVDLLNNYRNSVGLLRSVPPELNNEDKKKAMSLLSERKELEQKKEGKDEALVKPIQARIDAINEQLTKLSEDAIQKQTAGEVSVQPEARVGEEMVQGEPTTGPQVTTQKGITEEKPKEKINVYRGIGNNVMGSDNSSTLWVAEDKEVAKNYAGTLEDGTLNVESLEVEKPSNPIEMPYKLATDVRGSNIANNLRLIRNDLYESKKITDENFEEITKLIDDFESKAGNDLELFTTKLNKAEANEAFSKVSQALGFDGIIQKESAARGGEMTNTYGIFKNKYPSLLQPTSETKVVAATPTITEEVTVAEAAPVEQFTDQDRTRQQELTDALAKADKRRKNVIVGETTMSKADVKAELDALNKKEQKIIDAEVQAIEQMINVPKNENKNKVRQSVDNAIKSIAKILPNVKIVVHETNDDYVKATGDTDRSSGLYVPSKDGGTIHINLSYANTRTVGHEVFHAVLLRGIKDNAEAQRLAKAMMTAVAKSLRASGENQGLLNELEDFLSNYEENIQNEEYLAEVFGYLADGYPQLSAPEKNIVKRFIERVMKLFGLKPMTDKQVIDFMNTLSRKVATGEEITESDIPTKIKPSKTDKFGNLLPPTISSENNLSNRKQSIVDKTKSSVVEGKTVSTRLPKKDDIHFKNDYIVSIASLEEIASKDKGAESQYIKIANEIASYNLLKTKQIQNFDDAKKIIKEFKDLIKSNLKWLYNSFGNDVRDISKLWYDGANKICNDIASEYNYSIEQVSGVMAVLSPQMDWFRNLSLGERVIDIYTKQQNTLFDSKMIDYVNNATSGTGTSKVPLFKDSKEIISRVKGKKLSELSNKDKAYFIRVFDEVYNSRQYNNISPNGDINGLVRKSDGTPGACGWGAFPTIEKSISILQNGSIENISSNLGNMHKVRNFFNNISNPNDKNAVTIDTHAVAAALLLPLSGSSKQVIYNFGGAGNVGTGMTGTYPVYADAYRELANNLGLLPREVQSITWEAVRGLFKAVFKSNKKNEIKINDIWNKYSLGEILIDDVHSYISEIAGGISKPVWYEYIADGNVQSIDENSAAVNQSELDSESISITPRQQKAKNNLQDIVKQARANGYSDAGIRAYFKKNGLSDTEIDTLLETEKGAAKEIKLSEDTLPGYTKLMNRINGVIERGRKSGKSDEQIMNNVIANVESRSTEYANATNQQREQIIRDIRALFGKKEKKAPTAEKVVGKPKPKKVTVNEMSALKDQIRLEAKAAKEAKGDLNAKRKQLAAAINAMAKSGVMTIRQAEIIIRRVNTVNLDNPDMVERLLDYADKVFKDADYADKLKTANKFKSNIKTLSKNENKNGDLRFLGNQFIQIDPSMVEDIKSYIDMASKIQESIKGSTLTATGLKQADIVNISEAYDYINEALKNQEKVIKEITANRIERLLSVDVSDLTYNQMLELIDLIKREEFVTEEDKETLSKKIDDLFDLNKEKEKSIRDTIENMFSTYSSIIDSMFRTGKDPFVVYDESLPYEKLQFKKSDIKLVREFMNMDLNKLSAREALLAVDALNNFITNRSTANMATVVGKYRAKVNSEKLVKENIKSKALRLFFSKGLGRLATEQLVSLPMVFERLFKSPEIGLRVMEDMGLTDVMNGASKAITDTSNIVNEYMKVFSNKKPNKKAFNDVYNIIERGMVAHMSRSKVGDARQIQEEFNDRKREIEESIKVLSKGTDNEQKKAEVYKEVYNKILKDSKNSDEVKSKADKINIQAVNWMTKEWNKHYSDLADVSLSVYNTMLDKDKNYTPDRYQLLESGKQKPIDENASSFNYANGNISEKKSGTLMKTRDKKSGLPKDENGKVNRYVDLSFDSVNASALYSAFTDINTAQGIKQVKAFMGSDAFEEIIPNANDRNILEDRIKLAIRNIKQQNQFYNSELDKLARALDEITRFSASMALAGPTQVPKQTFSVGLNTLVNTGQLPSLDILYDKDKMDFINKSGRAIANRGPGSQIYLDSVNRMMEEAARSKPEAALKLLKKANDLWLKWTLANPDAFIAKASWLAYYEKSLKDQGLYKENVKPIVPSNLMTGATVFDGSSGIDYSTHELNEKAANYAQMMVDRNQNITDSRLAGSIYAGDMNAYNKFFIRTLLPLASFRLNQWQRNASDFIILTSETSSLQDKAKAFRSLSAFGVEQAMYRGIAVGFGIIFWKLADLILTGGEEEDEEEWKKRINNMIKGQATGLVTDVISPFPIADPYVKPLFNYGLSLGQDLMKIEEKDKLSIYTEDMNEDSFAKSLGMYGIALDKALSIYEDINMSITGEFKDNFNNTKYVNEEGRNILKNSITPSILFNLGLIPGAPEFNNIMGKVKRQIKKSGETKKQIEKNTAYAGYDTLEEFEKLDPEKYNEYSKEGGPLYEYKQKNKESEETEEEKAQKYIKKYGPEKAAILLEKSKSSGGIGEGVGGGIGGGIK